MVVLCFSYSLLSVQYANVFGSKMGSLFGKVCLCMGGGGEWFDEQDLGYKDGGER